MNNHFFIALLVIVTTTATYKTQAAAHNFFHIYRQAAQPVSLTHAQQHGFDRTSPEAAAAYAAELQARFAMFRALQAQQNAVHPGAGAGHGAAAPAQELKQPGNLTQQFNRLTINDSVPHHQ